MTFHWRPCQCPRASCSAALHRRCRATVDPWPRRGSAITGRQLLLESCPVVGLARVGCPGCGASIRLAPVGLRQRAWSPGFSAPLSAACKAQQISGAIPRAIGCHPNATTDSHVQSASQERYRLLSISSAVRRRGWQFRLSEIKMAVENQEFHPQTATQQRSNSRPVPDRVGPST